MAERLSTLDASFLYLERPDLHYHVGGLAILDPNPARGPVTAERLRELVTTRIHLVPRFRQRALFPPWQTGRPVWCDDPAFDPEYHIRHEALPRPGGPRELAELVGRIHSTGLELDRPLWEMYLIDGLEDGHQAILTKTHHCMVDGVSGIGLCTVLLDVSPDQADPVPPPWRPRALPSNAQLALDATIEGARERLDAATGELLRAIRSPRATMSAAARAVRGAGAFVRAGVAPRAPFHVPVGGPRRFAMTELPFDEVRFVKDALGVTVNDLMLTTVAEGLARLLRQRGVGPTDPSSLRTMIPISTRTGSGATGLGNEVTVAFVDLPTGPLAPLRRLRLVHDASRRAKASHEGDAASALIHAAMWLPPVAHAEVARLGNAHLPLFNVVTSSIPGPDVPLWLDGARVLAYYPLMPLGERAALSVATVTLVGVMAFGFTADRTAFPDLDRLAGNAHDAFIELRKAAERSAGARRHGRGEHR